MKIDRMLNIAIAALVLACFALANIDSRADASATHVTASGGVVLNTHNVVLHSTLPACAVEDASAGPLPCAWNITSTRDGYSYWVSRSGQTHYVWAADPHRNGWHWLDATADCVVRGETYRCANGTTGQVR